VGREGWEGRRVGKMGVYRAMKPFPCRKRELQHQLYSLHCLSSHEPRIRKREGLGKRIDRQEEREVGKGWERGKSGKIEGQSRDWHEDDENEGRGVDGT
jgi:hypothetical protein